MNVGYVLNLRKAMGVVEIVALNKEGVKTVFHLHNAQYKIDTASVYKGSCFQARSNQPFWKKIKVILMESLKRKLSLGNN